MAYMNQTGKGITVKWTHSHEKSWCRVMYDHLIFLNAVAPLKILDTHIKESISCRWLWRNAFRCFSRQIPKFCTESTRFRDFDFRRFYNCFVPCSMTLPAVGEKYLNRVGLNKTGWRRGSYVISLLRQAMDMEYGLTKTGNSEVRFCWHQLCLRSHANFIVPHVLDFVTSMVRPLSTVYRSIEQGSRDRLGLSHLYAISNRIRSPSFNARGFPVGDYLWSHVNPFELSFSVDTHFFFHDNRFRALTVGHPCF